MIISDFYQTKIEVVKSDTTTSYYNVNIDATDVQVIVSLIDFNGAPVTGKSVTLKCDNGYFIKYGSGTSTSSLTATGNTTTKSITATTDSNGKISATYKASEWGLCTFSTNNVNTQVKVEGWKIVDTLPNTIFSGKAWIYSNGKEAIFKVSDCKLTYATWTTLATTAYKPLSQQSMIQHIDIIDTFTLTITTSGQIRSQATAQNNAAHHTCIRYVLATPLY